LLLNSVTALLVTKYSDFSRATSLLTHTPPSHSHKGTTSEGRAAAERLAAQL